MSSQLLRECFLEGASNDVSELVDDCMLNENVIGGLTEGEITTALELREQLSNRLELLDETVLTEGALAMIGGHMWDALTFKDFRTSFTATNFASTTVSAKVAVLGKLEADLIEFIEENASETLNISDLAESLTDVTGRGGNNFGAVGLSAIVRDKYYSELTDLMKKSQGKSSFASFGKLFKAAFLSTSVDVVVKHYGVKSGSVKRSDLIKIVKSDFKRIVELVKLSGESNDGLVGSQLVPGRVLAIVPDMVTWSGRIVRNIVRLGS